MPAELQIFAVPGIPEVTRRPDLAEAIADTITRTALEIHDGDVLVIAQKIVSKAEGAVVALRDVTPSAFARHWAATYAKDPAVIEVVLRESRRLVRTDRGIIISETRHGFVCANAGVDSSNVPPGYVTVLPRDPDRSAERLRATLSDKLGHPIAIIIADTFGRPWREGVVNVAIGVAGLQPLADCRGHVDPFGRRMQATVIAVADELAGAAELVMGKTHHIPVALIRGAARWSGEGAAAMLVRRVEEDLFR